MKTYETTSEAYLATLADVYDNYEYKVAPRGQPIREKLDYTFRVLQPDSLPIETEDVERNAVIRSYTEKEMELYNSCSNRVEDFAKASKFWEKLANPDGTVNSSYGFLIWKNKSHGNPSFAPGDPMLTPWDWAKQCLIADKDTRQAILRFNLPEHAYKGVKDFACTMYGNWLIRDDRLHLSIALRSNDWVKGIAYDMPFFCSLMDKMLEELIGRYPTLTKGHYTHTANSAHIYEKDDKVILSMLGRQ